MSKSQRLGFPMLAAGQAQKELTHNEALLLLDALVQGCSPSEPANDPPQSPEAGLAYICGEDPTGAWAGHARSLACYSDGGWRFVSPVDGMHIHDRASGCRWRFASGSWTLGIVKVSEVQVDGVRVLSAQQPAIANTYGGSTVDSEARSTLSQVLAALRAHGIIAATG